MFLYLLLLFTLVPVIELVILIEVGSRIGALNTVAVVLLTGVLGAFLARSQGFMIIRKIRADLEAGRVPADKLLDGVLILIGGVFLLTPGFLTDTAGFIMLIPPTRALMKKAIRKRIHTGHNGGDGFIDVDRI